MMSEQLSPRKITLEEVLRLKRAERPAKEFWTEFEEQLRAKQLAAIVSRKPWWRIELARVAAGLRGLRLPIGAVAALAFAFVAVRENPWQAVEAPTGPDLVVGSESAVAAPGAPSVNAFVHALSAPDVAHTAGWENASSFAPVEEEGLVGVVEGAVSAEGPAVDRSESRMPSLLAAVEQSGGPSSSGFIPVAAMADVPTGSLTGRAGLNFHAMVEPLTQITALSDGRRARLAALTEVPSPDNRRRSSLDSRARERIVNRLNDDQLYLHFSRVGVDRGALSVRF